MKSPDLFQVVYRGEVLTGYKPGGWVFFQRPKECGGGFWLGKTYDFVFMLEIPHPVSIGQGWDYINEQENPRTFKLESVDDFKLV
ncbi:hypothetical protein [Pantoea trifolii]|uniref:DUF2829 domain-containing protein n=1 Tax=Pantoea trifolii TaxID=2968030 RepID=A0ABT1VNJ6_9GAMM|nr:MULTISPECIES: hypothetical protein [unclassified Pantoea]MCQ8229115.1 hypothetical protein [Pantoea sp. MMK2]MCQ8237289.1 hypothetical protein [Pantoea sp. MMK3]